MLQRSALAMTCFVLLGLAAPRANAQQSIGPGMTYSAANGYHVVVADLDSDSTEVRVSLHKGRSLDVVTEVRTVRSHWSGLVRPEAFATASLFAPGATYPWL